MTYTALLDKVKQAPFLDFGDLFGQAINLFQKVWLQGLLMQILTVVISWGVLMMITLPMTFVSAFITSGDLGVVNDVSFIEVILILLLYLVIFTLMAMVQFLLQAGFYRIVRMKDRNRSGDLGVGFGMFIKKRYVKKVIVLALSQLGISIAAVLFFILPLFFVLVPLQFTVVIFAFHPGWSVNDIYKAAFSLGIKKWGITFLLIVVIGIVAAFTGLLACFIGIYATISIVYLPVYLVYKSVIGFTEDEDIIAQIGR